MDHWLTAVYIFFMSWFIPTESSICSLKWSQSQKSCSGSSLLRADQNYSTSIRDFAKKKTIARQQFRFHELEMLKWCTFYKF